MKASAPACSAAARTDASSAARVGPAGGCRRPCRGTDAGAAAPTRRAPARQPDRCAASGTSPTRIRPASGSTKRRSRFATVVLPAPVAPTRATTCPAGIVRSRPSSGRDVATGVGEPRPPRTGCRRPQERRPSRRATRSPAPAGRQRLVEDRERSAPPTVLPAAPGVVAGRQRPQRQEELGDDDQDGQRPVEGDRAGHQPQADLDRDERDRDRAAPFEHERGLERGPQHLHRRVAVAAADVADVGDLLAAAAEQLERRRAPGACRGRRRSASAARRSALGDRPCPAADEGQQQDEDRPGEQEDQDGRRVERRGSTASTSRRHRDGEGPRGLEDGHVCVERLESRLTTTAASSPLRSRPV